MVNVIDYFEDRPQLLRNNGLGMLLMPEDLKSTNPWFMVFIPQLSALIENINLGPIRFCFNADHKIQAYAIYSDQAIVLTAGMFDMLCKLASSLVSRGIYPAIGTTKNIDWHPEITNNLLSVRDLLRNSSFNWAAKPIWTEDPDRLELFFKLLQTMVRFVVLHEFGHLWHRHGLHRPKGHQLEIDNTNPGLIEPKKALESQARELLADQFSFRSLISIQHEEILHPAARESENRIRAALLSSPSDEIAFTLLAIYFYFYAVDTQNWTINDAHLYTHPPAPFRLKALLCDLIEFGALGIPPEECVGFVSNANFLASAAISTTFQRFPDLDWIKLMEDSRLSTHFANLCGEVPNWQHAS